MTERIAYEFDRYLYGSKVAEGVTVHRADSFEEATVIAARLCGGQRGYRTRPPLRHADAPVH
jgi:hypothetical protein